MSFFYLFHFMIVKPFTTRFILRSNVSIRTMHGKSIKYKKTNDAVVDALSLGMNMRMRSETTEKNCQHT